MSEKKMLIDRRAERLVQDLPQDDDRLLSTTEVADLLGTSKQFLEIARSRGGGPRFVKLSYRRVRYKIADIRSWLETRSHLRTSEYQQSK